MMWQRIRFVLFLAGTFAFGAIKSGESRAQTIDLRLGVTYADPGDAQSGGTFEVSALSTGGDGIAGLAARLTGVQLLPGIDSIVTPTTYNWITSINTDDGPAPPILDRGSGITEVLLGQDVSAPADLVMDIGGGAGTPGAQGPDPFGEGFDEAALLITGTFLPGETPAFSDEIPSAGNVFIPVVDFGDPPAAAALVATSVVTNLSLTVVGDYDGNGSVGPEDYDVWAASYGSTTQLAADGNGNSLIDAADYTIWRDNLPPTVLSVPEPGPALLAFVAGATVFVCRRR